MHHTPSTLSLSRFSRWSLTLRQSLVRRLAYGLLAIPLSLSWLPLLGECSPLSDRLIQTERVRLLPCADKATVAILGSRASVFESALHRLRSPLTIVNRQTPGRDLCQGDFSSATPFVMYFVLLSSRTFSSAETRLQMEVYRTDSGALLYRGDQTVAEKDVNNALAAWASELGTVVANSSYQCTERFTIEVTRRLNLSCSATVVPRPGPQPDSEPKEVADTPPSISPGGDMVVRRVGVNHTLSTKDTVVTYLLDGVPLRPAAQRAMGSAPTSSTTQAAIDGEVRVVGGTIETRNISTGQRKRQGGCSEIFKDSEQSTISLFSQAVPTTFALALPQSPARLWTLTNPERSADSPVFRASSNNTLAPKTTFRSKECLREQRDIDAILFDETPITISIPHFDLVGVELPPSTSFSVCSRIPLVEKGLQRIPNLTTQEGGNITERCSKNTATVTASIRRAF